MLGWITILLSALTTYSPYSYGEILYGYLPPATRYGYGILRVYGFEDSTIVNVKTNAMLAATDHTTLSLVKISNVLLLFLFEILSKIVILDLEK